MKMRFAILAMVGMALLSACGQQCPSGYSSVNGSCTSSYMPTTGYAPSYYAPTGGYGGAGAYPYTTSGYNTGYPGSVCSPGSPYCNGSYLPH